jgi:hypothetical protein
VYVDIIRMLKHNTIKIDFEGIKCEYMETGVICLRMEPIVGSCEHGNEHLGSINSTFLTS